MTTRLPCSSKPLASTSSTIAGRALSRTAEGKPASGEAGGATGARSRLARQLEIEQVFVPDREAMAAALRVVLGLPRVLPGRGAGGPS
jgi:hypothetical protein